MEFKLSKETIDKYRECQKAIKIASEKMLNGISLKVRRSTENQRKILVAQASGRLLKNSIHARRIDEERKARERGEMKELFPFDIGFVMLRLGPGRYYMYTKDGRNCHLLWGKMFPDLPLAEPWHQD